MSVTLKKTPPAGTPTTTPGATKDLLKKLLKQVRNRAGQIPLTKTSKSKAAPKPTIVYNDTFKLSGSFEIAGGKAGAKVEIRWRQANFVKGMKYPPKSKAISYEVYVDGKKRNWPLNGPAYLDSNGRVYLPLRTPNLPRTIRSTQSFHSDNFKTLVKAIKQIRNEAAYIKKHGLASLPGAVRNKKGQVVTTKGALVLAALIMKIGAKKIARAKIDKTSALATRTFDNIQRLLRMKGIETIVHRAVELAGLHVSFHPTRGRSLLPGETSAAGAARKQYNNLADIAKYAPAPPWMARLVDIAMDGDNFGTNENQRGRGQAAVRQVLADENQRNLYADAIANYLMHQDHLFPAALRPDQVRWIEFAVKSLLRAAYLARTKKSNDGDQNYDALRDAIIEAAPAFGLNPDVPADRFVDMILNLPGFERGDNGLTLHVSQEFSDLDSEEARSRDLQRAFSLPVDVARLIFLLALRMVYLGL